MFCAIRKTIVAIALIDSLVADLVEWVPGGGKEIAVVERGTSEHHRSKCKSDRAPAGAQDEFYCGPSFAAAITERFLNSSF